MPEQLFPLGRIVMTTNLQHQLQEAVPEHWKEKLRGFIDRHVSGDWGDLEQADKDSNTEALESGGWIFSAYHCASVIKIWIITEADRSYTTVLLPQDY